MSAALAVSTVSSLGFAGSAQASPAPAGAALSSQECAANKAAPIAWASSFAFAGAAGIVDVFAADHLGYFKDMCLNVKLITNSYNSESLVSTDAAQVTGSGSAADYLLAAAGGQNVKAIATGAAQSNYAILTQSKFPTLKSLAGQSFGYHQTVPVVVSEMLKKAGVLKKVDFIDDNSYDPTLLTDGKFGAIQAYQSNEPLMLKADHLSFHEFTPQEYRITGTTDVTEVNATFLSEHPEAVKDFLRADLKAFQYCIKNPVACINIEQSYAKESGVTYDYAHELQRWKIESKLAAETVTPSRPLGVETKKEWAPEDKALVTYGLLKKAPSLARYENTTIAASLYKNGKLIWP